MNVFDPILNQKQVVILDGGLATELEIAGFDLSNPLWSAGIIEKNPDQIQKIHLSYLMAGSNCITGAGYQATIPGFIAAGFPREKAVSLIRKSVTIALDARRQYLKISGKAGRKPHLKPLVAAGIGPYGAYLADGSEYRGNYGLTKEELIAFHKPRWDILAETAADVLACETIPSMTEAEALRALIETTPSKPVWISFACQDEELLNDGSQLSKCAEIFKDAPQVAAIGINCTNPKYVSNLICIIKETVPGKHIMVYPNAGGRYQVKEKKWTEGISTAEFVRLAQTWYHLGARLIGGCCQTRPENIQSIKKMFSR